MSTKVSGLMEQMAIAVLRGDLVAALALKDILEETGSLDRGELKGQVNSGGSVSTWEVWRWPETRAFLDRLGVDYYSQITCITIRLHCDEIVKVSIEQNGEDAK